MATPKQRYTARLTQVFNRQDKLADDTIRRILTMLEDMRQDIGGILLTSAEVDVNNLQSILIQIDTAVNTFQSSLGSATTTAVNGAYSLGGSAVTEPLAAAGISLPSLAVNQQRVTALEAFGLDLVKGITEDMRLRITSRIRLSAVGGISTPDTFALDAMRAITDILGIIDKRKMLVKGVAAQAERIWRTELNRIFSIGNYDKQLALSERVPGLQKQWMATGDFRTRDSHLSAHGQIRNVDQPFVVGGEELMFPHDPAASAKNVVYCRCRSVAVHPEIGAIVTAEDARIEKEKERRDE
jgi:hypothetical protein